MRVSWSAAEVKCLVGIAVTIGILVAPLWGGEAASQWNVLLITIDTWRFDRAGINDSRFVQTPHIDALARKAVVFRHAYAHNPVTLPSHVNILTGTTPLYHGISDNTGFRLADRFLTLAEHLQAAGYRTAAFVGAFPLDSRFGLDQGFDLYDDFYGTHNSLELFFVERPAEKVVQPALRWLSLQKGRWFAWLHLFDPHQPYLPPAPFRERYANDPYSGEVAYADSQIGVLFDFLATRGQLSHTVIVLTGDHGEALGEKGEETHSYFAYNNTIHIPLILYFPGCSPAFVKENACHADIFPTICSLLHLPVPAHLQGESLLPLISGESRRYPFIYFESLNAYLNRDWAPLRGYINGMLKFINLPIREVYDLTADADETVNLAGRKPVGEYVNQLLRLMKLLSNPRPNVRSEKISAEELQKLQSLGYIAANRSVHRERSYGAADDLKTLLPLQNKMLQGVNLYQLGKTAEGEGLLREVIAASPTFSLAYNHLAAMMLETKGWREAVAVLADGLRKNPGDISIMAKMGIIIAENGDARRAIQLLSACLRNGNTDADVFNYLGIAHYRNQEWTEALASYGQALALDKNNASVYNNMGSLYLSRFLQNNDQESFRLAVQNFRAALAIDPKLYAAYNGLGAAFKKMKRTGEAIDCWRQALAIKPDYPFALINLGIALLESGDARGALRYLHEYRDKYSSKLPAAERRSVERLILEAENKIEK